MREAARNSGMCGRNQLRLARGELGRGEVQIRLRRAGAALTREERAVQTAGTAKGLPDGLWRGLMFNTFHDILPASCTEIALEQQSDEVRGICHEALTRESDALVARAAKLKPAVPAAPAPD